VVCLSERSQKARRSDGEGIRDLLVVMGVVRVVLVEPLED